MEFWSEVTSFAEQAAKRSHERPQGLAAQVLYRADLIKSLSLLDSLNLSTDHKQQVSAQELERFGINGELREFVKEITMTTFQDFPFLDDTPMSNVPKVSNVWQDLTEWQARHATLMLSNVKEISKLHYELCPRFMNERKFWRIYLVLVNSHIAPFETRYDEAKLEAAEAEKAKAEKEKEASKSISLPKMQDLDVFLIGDLRDSEEGSDNEDYLM